MEIAHFFERAELLNLSELRRQRRDWTDRLPLLPEKPSKVTMGLVKRHWSYRLPRAICETYMLWLARRRYRLNLEQIEIDELDELCALEVDSSENCRAVYEEHGTRRVAARFLVATRERRKLQRLARRWDVEVLPMIVRGEAREEAISQARRAIREARWTFIERFAKLVIPILSLIIALVALLLKH